MNNYLELVQRVAGEYYQWVENLNELTIDSIQSVFDKTLPFETTISELTVFPDGAEFAIYFEDINKNKLKVLTHVRRKPQDQIDRENEELKNH